MKKLLSLLVLGSIACAKDEAGQSVENVSTDAPKMEGAFAEVGGTRHLLLGSGKAFLVADSETREKATFSTAKGPRGASLRFNGEVDAVLNGDFDMVEVGAKSTLLLRSEKGEVLQLRKVPSYCAEVDDCKFQGLASCGSGKTYTCLEQNTCACQTSKVTDAGAGDSGVRRDAGAGSRDAGTPKDAGKDAPCSKTVQEPGGGTYTPAQGEPLPPGPKELVSVDEVVGTGREAKTGDTVRVHYTGTLMNGKKFDSSRDKGDPFEFKLGAGMVIKGWDQGVAGMKVGGKRKLTIPAALGYGERGQPPVIPADAGLKFDVELLEVK
jgi:FKBP-type peptidyl-prolyl cis-trans isomerase FkpA